LCLLLHNLWWCLKMATTRNHHGYVKSVKKKGRKHDIRSQSKTKTKNLIDLSDGIFCTICLKSCFPNQFFNCFNFYEPKIYCIILYCKCVHFFFLTKMSFSNYFTFLKFFFAGKKKNNDYIILKHFWVSHTHHIHFKFYPMFPQYIKNIFI